MPATHVKHNPLRLIVIAVTGVAIVAIGFVSLLIIADKMEVMTVTYQRLCVKNLLNIGNALRAHATAHGGVMPAPSAWCDELVSQTDLVAPFLRCGYERQARSTYAMNAAIDPNGNNPPDMVLVFESKAGWNLCGGQELLAPERHRRFPGCNVLFADGHVEFVKEKDLPNLRWTRQQKSPRPAQ